MRKATTHSVSFLEPQPHKPKTHRTSPLNQFHALILPIHSPDLRPKLFHLFPLSVHFHAQALRRDPQRIRSLDRATQLEVVTPVDQPVSLCLFFEKRAGTRDQKTQVDGEARERRDRGQDEDRGLLVERASGRGSGVVAAFDEAGVGFLVPVFVVGVVRGDTGGALSSVAFGGLRGRCELGFGRREVALVLTECRVWVEQPILIGRLLG
jgi:hypothetical protein